MKIIPLFASNLYTYSIDPTTFDKQNIVSTIVDNYNRSPHRNNWDVNNTGVISNLHHYYNDWDNNNFTHVDLSSLVEVYKNNLQIFLNDIGIGENLEFKFKINNITVYNDNSQFMNEHHHRVSNDSLFSVIHYLQADETSNPITFTNPSSFFIYPDVKLLNAITTSLSDPNVSDSMFFENWSIPVEEDQLIIFPSWLKHKVMPSNKTPTKHRIAIVTNIHIKP